MSRNSILKRTAAAIVVFAGLLAPASANQPVGVFPDLPVSATADQPKSAARSRPIELTSRRPWLAPVGHRQPQLADVPRPETVSAWERQQQQLDHELDRKLVICRGR
ncbi:hypothetical protein [Bradyrhizobium ivorense]|uniref:hypothetical protein n=1 Tax=Bradyrhizobium ivorense TaxID=2511166 RepID=UPI0010BC16D7|nr:hypothetical protein [Bradyrhizobium ivorense]VIO71889.1 hypothetical protein CI41S_32560 [Bradyrhizobium ivorense]